MVVIALATAGAAVVSAGGPAARAAVASAPRRAHSGSHAVRAGGTPVSHTIAGAGQLTLGDEQSGGGGPVDFWLIQLTGGDQVQFSVQDPGDYYYFDLYAPGTTDTGFGSATPVDVTNTNQASPDDITLQAPYTGIFVLAVCENTYQSCSSTDSGSGSNPMDSYTFTPTVISNACGSSPAGEVQAGATIAAASQFTLGDCQAGGGGHVDFWLVQLTGGDQVEFSVQEPGDYYYFDLYAPGTTDVEFASATPVDTAYTNQASPDDITLQAPYTGTFVLAVCENTYQSCSSTDSGSGTNPMAPYTFTPTVISNACGSSPAGEVQAGATIAAASQFTLGDCQAGGGGHVDFWLVQLTGGDQVEFSVQEPGDYYYFDLYAPGTTDAGFASATPVDTAYTNQASPDDITLQAPYTGTFVLAVCENTGGYDCSYTDSGYGTNPMNPYTFTPTVIGNACGSSPTGEVQARATIAAASQLGLGNCQAGGGGPIDFWLVQLTGGDQVQFSVQEPGDYYYFELYAPGTTDAGFGSATPVATAYTDSASSDDISLQAPYTGTFVLAVCENTGGYDCSYTDSGYGTNPMNPYTFTPTLTGGPATTTSLKLSASSVTYGKEEALKLSVTVTAQFSSAQPTGTVTIKAGSKTICTVKLSDGTGTCSPSSQKLLAVGTYQFVASYGGSKTFSASASKAATLKVVKAKRK